MFLAFLKAHIGWWVSQSLCKHILDVTVGFNIVRA